VQRDPHLGGRINGIVASPTNPNLLIVATPGAGVWKTTDNGANWVEKSAGLGNSTVHHLEWDLINPNLLWAVTSSNLYSSVDLAEHWTNATLQCGPPLVPTMHHTDPYAFAQLSKPDGGRVVLWGGPCEGLSYSYDGTTFQRAFPSVGDGTNTDNCIESIAANAITGRVVFSTMAYLSGVGPHLFRSTCPFSSTPCLTWERYDTGLPLSNINIVLASTATPAEPERYIATDSGDTGVEVYAKTADAPWVKRTNESLAWDPRAIHYLGGSELFLGAVTSLQSLDLGVTWQRFDAPSQHPDVRSFAFTPGHLWTTTDGTVDGTYANLTHWAHQPGMRPDAGTAVPVTGPNGIAAIQSYYVSAVPAPTPWGIRLFMGTQDNYGFCSDDMGLTWALKALDSSSGDYAAMVVSPSNPKVGYAMTTFGEPNVSTNLDAPTCAAVTFAGTRPAVTVSVGRLLTNSMIAVHPVDPTRVYFIAGLAVGISKDSGKTITTTAKVPSYPSSLYVEASGAIYVGSDNFATSNLNGVFVSRDDGATWSPFAINGTKPMAVRNMAVSTAGGGSGTFYAATTDGLYRKPPGSTLDPVAGLPAGVVSDVVVDPTCPTRIYAAYGFALPWGMFGGGIWISLDNGVTWSSMTRGIALDGVPISGVQVDPTSRYVFAATYGRGAWIFDYKSVPACP
jgi:hypothetical protein